MRQDLKNAIKLLKEYCIAVDEENKRDWMTCRGCVIQDECERSLRTGYAPCNWEG